MDTVIKESLDKAISYDTYKRLVKDLIAEGKSTGEQQSEALLNYSVLNDRRMQRLAKTLKIDETSQQKIAELDKELQWLVLTESWCGDAAQTLPMIAKVADATTKIDLKVVLRDENEALMAKFLTNGNKAIPKLIALDAAGNVVGDWGPRPQTATHMVNAYKAKFGALDATFKEDLQKWYNKDKGKDTLNDLLALLDEIKN